ncbi:hypothetical protein KUTeg_000562 [Tegillarca granosa]|uniref:Uncharacterized protein n=1 Tax=Tegillarca granosa TaxID=220873 RepID=A0ABQ9G103_TEGGR|nr:hypothetical protein KUTeg_000562 [Tegillarca granosa]
MTLIVIGSSQSHRKHGKTKIATLTGEMSNSPHGRPVVMYMLPSSYNTRSYLHDVDQNKVDVCQEECTFRRQQVCDEDIDELCRILMEENVLAEPTAIEEAISLYSKLRYAFYQELQLVLCLNQFSVKLKRSADYESINQSINEPDSKRYMALSFNRINSPYNCVEGVRGIDSVVAACQAYNKSGCRSANRR